VGGRHLDRPRYKKQTTGKVDEIAKELNTTSRKVERIIKISQRLLSLEMPVGEEQDSHLGDFIPDELTLGPTDAASHQLLREQMEDILTSLSPRGRGRASCAII
jgi:RNA polymerase primary sigma factor